MYKFFRRLIFLGDALNVACSAYDVFRFRFWKYNPMMHLADRSNRKKNWPYRPDDVGTLLARAYTNNGSRPLGCFISVIVDHCRTVSVRNRAKKTATATPSIYYRRSDVIINLFPLFRQLPGRAPLRIDRIRADRWPLEINLYPAPVYKYNKR